MNSALFLATLSQALQAVLPIAMAHAWFTRRGERRTAAAVRLGILAAMPATIVASALFRASAHQARVEASLATVAAFLAAGFLYSAWRDTAPLDQPTRRAMPWLAAAAAALLLIVRQAMEIGVVLFAAAFEVRSVPATLTVGIAALAGVGASVAAHVIIRTTSNDASRAAVRAFSVLFLAQVSFYALHEAAEGHLLPWSDVLHAATEPYGPDSSWAIFVSAALLVIPLGAAAFTRLRERLQDSVTTTAIAACAIGLVCAVVVVGRSGTASSSRAEAQPAHDEEATDVNAARFSAAPHVLFRNMRRGDAYGKLAVAPLASPDAMRATLNMPCERASFGGNTGICLQADRGVSTTFRAQFFDAAFAAIGGFDLGGSPSRTRVSPDGRFGTMTVFLSGQQHGYAATSFVTKTTLVDMSNRTVLVDNLETFSTWRDGARFAAPDFNFWGVTFTHAGTGFYASLRTGGQTYLVRGDIAARRLDVLRENVECPSLSPDNRRIAYKKRVGPEPTAWRIHILDLETMTDRTLDPEGRYVDDQVEWIDNTRVLYALPHLGTADVWDAPIDGSGPARIFIHDAESPIVVRSAPAAALSLTATAQESPRSSQPR